MIFGCLCVVCTVNLRRPITTSWEPPDSYDMFEVTEPWDPPVARMASDPTLI